MAVATTTEQKIKVSVGLTSRIVDTLQRLAKERGISFGDAARRALDEWIEARNAPVKVLDRDKGEIRTAR